MRNNFRTPIWCCVGGHEILRLLPTEIADAAADRRLHSPLFLVQPVQYLEGIFTGIFPGDSVLFTRDNRYMWTGDGLFLVLASSRGLTPTAKISDSGKKIAHLGSVIH
ncbi:hypothetical protein KCP73_07070 [Salmonella enterica subsp. enterica]|nr:hypothetical protein KCP73_07070 [Salmonella enterica subsp. enterica]